MLIHSYVITAFTGANTWVLIGLTIGLKNQHFFCSLLAFMFGDDFGSLFPPIFGSLWASFFFIFFKARGSQRPPTFMLNFSPSTLPSPEILPKMVAQSPPKVPKKVPRRPSEPQKPIHIAPQSLLAKLQDYQPTIQSKNYKTTRLQDYKLLLRVGLVGKPGAYRITCPPSYSILITTYYLLSTHYYLPSANY